MSRAGRWRGLALVLLLVACRSRAASDPPKLERLTMTPHAAHRSAGQSQRFTVIGHYAGGTTKNLTQRVEYASSDPAVASAPNAKGDRSRVEAVAPGKATITATDRATGISTHASGDDVTIVVLGGLERLTLTPEFVHRPLGQTQRLTATGYYPGGVTRNLTQHVVYSSSDPQIVAAPNAPGDKSRIETVGIGSATVSAVDPESGVSSSASGGDATVNVESPKIP